MQVINSIPKPCIGRRLDLNAHKDSPIVQNYIRQSSLSPIPKEKITGWFVPNYSDHNFYVTDESKIIGYLIKGHYIKGEIKKWHVINLEEIK